MNNDLEKIYEQRFAGMEEKRRAVWQVLCRHFFQQWVPTAATVLDIGAGYCEFINNIQCARKYAIDLNPSTSEKAGSDVSVLAQDVGAVWPLESSTIDVAFSSNFLEHLPDKKVLMHCLQEMSRVLRPGGTVILLGPNIRFCYDVYWDFLDHHIALSDRSIEEALAISGFEIVRVVPQFLPYTMQAKLPPLPIFVRLYLLLPLAWPIFGKQFLVIARKKQG